MQPPGSALPNRRLPVPARAGSAIALLLLVLLAGIKLHLAGREDSIWMDEVYSLQLAGADLPRLFDLAVQDLHPPLYYLALHSWLRSAGRLSIAPSIRVARALNIVVWIIFAAASWRILTRALGEPWGPFGSVILLSSAHVVQFTQDARGYGFAVAGTSICLLLVLLDLLDDLARRRARRIRSIAYVTAGAVAAWSHLLSWLLLALIGTTWLLLTWALNRGRDRRRFSAPLLANAVLVLTVVPWFGLVPDQISALRAAAPQWMTAPTLANLARVFSEWLPFGRDGYGPAPAAWALLATIGVLSATPIALLGFNEARRSIAMRRLCRDRECWLGIAAALVTLLFVGILWVSARAGWFSAFHGPRYPCLGVGAWALALILATKRLWRDSGSVIVAGVLLLPWLFGSWFGVATQVRAGQGGLAAEFRTAISGLGAGAGAPLFHMPGELTPFFERTLADLGSEPVARLPCALLHGEATLIVLNRWRGLDTPESLMLHSAMAVGILRAESNRPVPSGTGDYTVLELAPGESSGEYLERWCASGIALPPRPTASSALSIATPEAQSYRDGWSYLEFDRRLRPFRWTRTEKASLRFPGKLLSGKYLVRLSGATRRTGEQPEHLVVSTPSGMVLLDESVAPGEFEVSFDFDVGQNGPRLTALVVQHSLSEVTVGGSGPDSYRRSIGVLLRQATLERMGEPR